MEEKNINQNNTDRTVTDVLAGMKRTAEASSANTSTPPHFNQSTATETPFTRPTHDFSRYQDASSDFAKVPRETVYIDNSEDKKKKKSPKARLGIGAVAAVVAVCMVFSGGAAFAGTYIANRMTKVEQGGVASGNPGSPSVIFQSTGIGNKTPGTYTQVAEAVAPTVVEITTESVSTSSYMWGSNYVVSGAGSGVIISADGLIITNNHVVSGASAITVRMTDGTEYPATIVGTDADSDIAVIRVDGKNLPCALIGDSTSLKVGEEVVAVGNPLGEFGGSVTNGIISGLERSVNIEGTEMTLLQTNAAVNPGNSGGGLFNLYGELIGIVNAKSSSSSSGTAVEGIGFAIPINHASEVAAELVNYGYVRGKASMGITIVDIADSWKAMQYRVSSLGVYVVSSAYAENKFESGDRIVAINETAVEFSDDVRSALKAYKVGDVITVKVVRAGQYVDVTVTLHEFVPTATETPSLDQADDKKAN